MSGPPYPHPNPAPGSNAIGSFIIGVSPIGTIPSFDVWQTIIGQYGNSPIIDQLCTNMGQYVDQTANFDAFYDTIWNIDTAVGLGLDIWGRILGVSRVLQVSAGAYFGFGEAAAIDPLTIGGFDQQPFFNGQALTSNFALTDAAYRPLLLAKALANICDGSIPAINQILLNLFPNRGNAFVTDGMDLTMTYSFAFFLTPVESAIVVSSGVLPRTSGVSISVVQGVP